MSFLTPRPRGLALVVSALVVGSVVASLAGQATWSVAVTAVLVGTACILVLDVRHRQQRATRSQHRVEEAVASVAAELRDLRVRTGEATAAVTRTTAAVEELEKAAEAHHAETTQRLAQLDHEPLNEVQALLQLLRKVPDAPPLPPVGGWALTPASLLGIWDVVEQERPATIVECGSGSSTVWLCYAARAVGGVRVVSLEHKGSYARRTEALLAEHGLQDLADVRHARMQEVEVEGELRHWYDPSCLEDLDAIDMLLVDGPPKNSGPLARFPAVPILADRLAPGALIVVDDATRPDEQEAMRRWTEHYGVEVERQLSRDALLLRRR